MTGDFINAFAGPVVPGRKESGSQTGKREQVGRPVFDIAWVGQDHQDHCWTL